MNPPMNPRGPSLPTDTETRLWRYMDLAKFVSLLQTAELHFQRSDCFEDKLEGSLPLSLQQRLKSLGPSELRRQRREQVFVSCWHINEYESAGMWSLYGAVGSSIAIRTNYGRLVQVLPEGPESNQILQIGQVGYVDFGSLELHSDFRNVYSQFFLKRQSYSHEKELRILAIAREGFRLPSTARVVDKAVKIPVSLSKLIEAVFVSPKSDEWYRDMIAGLIEEYGLEMKVSRSELDSEPLF